MTHESADTGELCPAQLRRLLPSPLGPIVANTAGMLKPAHTTLLGLPLLFAACGLDSENSEDKTRAVITQVMSVGQGPTN